MRTFLVIAAALLLIVPASLFAAPESESAQERVLREHGITPDLEGIGHYLRQLTPTEEQRKQAELWIAQLGNSEYQKREAATRRLVQLPHPPQDALKAAAKSNDPEVRWRAGRILKTHAARDETVLHAVLTVIAQKQLKELSAEVLATVPHLERPYGTALAARALLATVRDQNKEDKQRLRDALHSKSADVRAIAAAVLPQVDGDAGLKYVQPFLDAKGEDDIVRLAAATAFAEAGRREAVRPLIGLLHSDDLTVRTRSHLVLRTLTGKQFGFASYDSDGNRAKAIRKWNGWLATAGKTAPLKHPLDLNTVPGGYLNGNILLSYGYRSKVVELSPSMKEVWSYSANRAFSAEKLSDGNYLISTYGPNEVQIVTPDKKVIWRMKFKSCINARPLSNGNILVAGHTSNQVWEVNRDKKIVWQHTLPTHCYDARRLPNGNTMIASQKGLLEITPKGKTVWEYAPTNGRSYGFHPLPNGNVVVAHYNTGKVVEVTREKKIVWSVAESSPFDACRLPNGNTLIATSSRFVEVDREGRKLWTRTGNQHGRARR